MTLKTNRSIDHTNNAVDLTGTTLPMISSPGIMILGLGSNVHTWPITNIPARHENSSGPVFHDRGRIGAESEVPASESKSQDTVEAVTATARKEEDAKHPYFYFAYGADMASYFLEMLCETAAKSQARIKRRERANVAQDRARAISASGEAIIVYEDENSDDNGGRDIPTGQAAMRYSKHRTQDWSKQYSLVGLGKLNGYVWIVDEFGEAKILPSTKLAPVAGPNQAPRPTAETPIPKHKHSLDCGAKSRQTSHWRPEDWEAYFNAPSTHKPLPTKEESADWTAEVWQTYLTNPTAKLKRIPPAVETRNWTTAAWQEYLLAPLISPSPFILSPESPYSLEPVKSDVVYGIIYRLSPFLFTLVCNHHNFLLPKRALHQEIASHQDRTPESQPEDWYAPVTHVNSIGVNVFVGIGGLMPGEKAKMGRKILRENTDKKIALNRAVLDLKQLACPSAWLDEVVRQYVPKPTTPYESGYWH